MSYFRTHQPDFRLITAGDGTAGLRRNQVGGIAAVLAHFTLKDTPALVSMPTGTGKTAVLMSLAFLLGANKVLVITPSQLVRNQIAEDFKALSVLKRLGVVPADLVPPSVIEVDTLLATPEAWKAVLDSDVVVATPKSVSPLAPGVEPAPADAFDLVLMDEAHHSAASTWQGILDHFPRARRVLLTATPFRNDGKEIRADIVYTYSLRKAHEDGIFGSITYVPVPSTSTDQADVAIAKATEAVYRADQAAGLNHRLIVRTDLKSRADELKEIYAAHTTLKLKSVNSRHTLGHIKGVIAQLRAGDIDGVICVDMLGEGFDLPALKIAAIHSPHKSLAITLQFIGRFTRPDGGRGGTAKFVASVDDEIEVERLKLYRQDASWHDLVQGASEERIGKEVEVREFLARFQPLWGSNPTDLSVYSLQPGCHVKIYKVLGAVDLAADLRADDFHVVFHSTSAVDGTAILVWVSHDQPKWSDDPALRGQAHELLVVYHDAASGLLFVCSTVRRNDLYDRVIAAYAGDRHALLPLCTLKRVMAGWKDARFFNVGMRSRRAQAATESYRTIMGSAAQEILDVDDGLNYLRGHTFGKGTDENGVEQLLGMSSSSKIWSSTYFQVPGLVRWCRKMARKLSDPACDAMLTPLAFLDCGVQIDVLPTKRLFLAAWNYDCYQKDRRIAFLDDDERVTHALLHEVEIRVDAGRSDASRIVFTVGRAGEGVDFEFTLKPATYRPLPGQRSKVMLVRGFQQSPFESYLMENPPTFYYTDLSSLERDVYAREREGLPKYDFGAAQPYDWSGKGVCILSEVVLAAGSAGKATIQAHLKDALKAEFDVVLCDQGSGEIADLVGLKGGPEPRIALYHCKGSSKPKAGSRVDDLYEVCGQAMKSIIWCSRNRLAKRLKEDRAAREWVHGGRDLALAILDAYPSNALPLEIVVVQPGLDTVKAPKSDSIADLLSAVQGHLTTHANATLRVMGS